MAELDESKKNVQGIAMKNDPPPIFYSTKPAIILIVDGKPVPAPIEKLECSIHRQYQLGSFHRQEEKGVLILVGNFWAKSKELKGPWAVVKTLPKDMDKLPAGQNFDDVKKIIPPPQTLERCRRYFTARYRLN